MFLNHLFMHSKTALRIKHGDSNESVFFASDLFEEVLNKGSDLRVRVTGRSMAPFLTSGDIVTIQKVNPGTLIKGDIVFFKTKEGITILHRLINMKPMDGENICFFTKGDALIMYDEPFYPYQVMGKVIRVEKKNGAAITFNMESYAVRGINYILALMQALKSGLMTLTKPILRY